MHTYLSTWVLEAHHWRNPILRDILPHLPFVEWNENVAIIVIKRYLDGCLQEIISILEDK